MKTNNIKNEQISAFADGEIDAAELNALMLDCRQEQHLQCWDVYHQIGDVLRSDDMAQTCSTDFNAKLFARLASEPAYPSPIPLNGGIRLNTLPLGSIAPHTSKRRFVRSSRMILGIAAGAAVLYSGGAYLVQGRSDGGSLNRLATWTHQQSDVGTSVPKATQAAPGSQVVVMRDPQIDAYLIAHQQFSPSLYSTAQFARAASFANESTK